MGRRLKQYFRLLAEDKESGALSKLMYPILDSCSGTYENFSQKIRRCYEEDVLKKKKLSFPVISVGNLTWGGSGKTPFVEYLVRYIESLNKAPMIMTRGYSHDEVEQYREHFPKTLISVGKDRYKAASKIAKKTSVDIGILDDGFQHWKLQRDLDIVTLSALNPFGNEKIIPRGSLREPIERIGDADVIVITHSRLVKASALRDLKIRLKKLASHALIVEAYLEPLFFYRAKKGQKIGLNKLQNRRVTTFSAVGAPRSFQLLLSHSQIRPVRNFEFTDHHVFSKKDLEEIKTVANSASVEEIITTEKDFYRSPEMISKSLNPLVLATEIRISRGEEMLKKRIRELIGSK